MDHQPHANVTERWMETENLFGVAICIYDCAAYMYTHVFTVQYYMVLVTY